MTKIHRIIRKKDDNFDRGKNFKTKRKKVKTLNRNFKNMQFGLSLIIKLNILILFTITTASPTQKRDNNNDFSSNTFNIKQNLPAKLDTSGQRAPADCDSGCSIYWTINTFDKFKQQHKKQLDAAIPIEQRASSILYLSQQAVSRESYNEMIQNYRKELYEQLHCKCDSNKWLWVFLGVFFGLIAIGGCVYLYMKKCTEI